MVSRRVVEIPNEKNRIKIKGLKVLQKEDFQTFLCDKQMVYCFDELMLLIIS